MPVLIHCTMPVLRFRRLSASKRNQQDGQIPVQKAASFLCFQNERERSVCRVPRNTYDIQLRKAPPPQLNVFIHWKDSFHQLINQVTEIDEGTSLYVESLDIKRRDICLNVKAACTFLTHCKSFACPDNNNCWQRKPPSKRSKVKCQESQIQHHSPKRRPVDC